jgi:hypothetical protein
MQFLSKRRLRRMAFIKMGDEQGLDAVSDLSELDMDDRGALDDAVLEMLGVKNKRERAALIDRLYGYLREFFEDIRCKEEKAIANKNKSKRRVSFPPAQIAAEIIVEVKKEHGNLLRSYSDFVDMNRPFSTFDLPAAGIPEVHEDMFHPSGSVRFMKGRKQLNILPTKTREQAALVALIATHGVRGLTRVPLDAQECIILMQRYEKFINDRSRRLRRMIEERTGDPDLQDRIFKALTDLVHHETRA